MQDISSFLQTHWQLATALVIILALLILLEFIKQKIGAPRVNPAQATRLINHDNAIVLDLRSSDAYKNGHIVGAVSCPFTELTTRIKKLEKSKIQPIILVCGAGTESPRAAAILLKEGFTVYLLQGGLRAWQLAEMPIVKG